MKISSGHEDRLIVELRGLADSKEALLGETRTYPLRSFRGSFEPQGIDANLLSALNV